MKSYIEVVAAQIWDENKFLICERSENKARGLLWEFVGSKVEKNYALNFVKVEDIPEVNREEFNNAVKWFVLKRVDKAN